MAKKYLSSSTGIEGCVKKSLAIWGFSEIQIVNYLCDYSRNSYMGPGPGLVTQFSTRNSTRVNLFSVELGIPHKTNKNQFNS